MRATQKTCAMVLGVMLSFWIFIAFNAYAGVPDIVLKQKKAVVTIYIKDKTENELITGSGFIVNSNGIIATNYHVISELIEQTHRTGVIKMENGAYYPIKKIVSFDEDNDIALIQVEGKELKPIKLARNYRPKQGDSIIVIGSPFGLETTVSDGIISSVRGNGDFIQITAPISPGSSGSPVFNLKGDVIGMATFLLKGGQNLNFAMPIKHVVSLLNGSKKTRKKTESQAKPDESGVEKPAKPEIASPLQNLIKENSLAFVEKAYVGIWVVMNDNGKLEIVYVDGASPAGMAGIQPGDIIEAVDNTVYKDRKTLFALYDRKKPGDFIEAIVQRNGRIISKKIQLSSHYFPIDLYALLREVVKDEPISIAVMIGDISNVFLKDKALEQWTKGMNQLLISEWESIFLAFLKHEKKVSIIDRQKTDAVVHELATQQMKGLQMKAGESLGASHIFIIDYSRFYLSETKATDVMQRRLVAVKSGNLLANVLLKTTVSLDEYKKPEKEISLENDFKKYCGALIEIGPLEKKAIDAWSSVTEKNYSTDSEMYDTLVNVVLPTYRLFLQKLEALHPATSDIQNIHNLYVEGTKLTLEGFTLWELIIKKQDITLSQEANEKLIEGKTKMAMFATGLESLKQKLGTQNEEK